MLKIGDYMTREEKIFKQLAKVLDEWDNLPNDVKDIPELEDFAPAIDFLLGLVDSEDEE